MNALMLSCRKASELIDKRSVIDLSMKEKVMLRMHTSMCDGCKAYQKQSELLDQILKNRLSDTEGDVPQLKNNALKQNIISKL